MRRAWLSIAGLFNYRPDIFDNLNLPKISEIHGDMFIDDIVPLDKDALINMLLFELGELGLVYINADMLKTMIGIWSDTEHDIWLELWKSKLYKYNPIWNKDGIIRETREIEKAGEHGSTTIGTGKNVKTLDTKEAGTETDSRTIAEESESRRTDTGTIGDSGNRNITNNETVSHNVTGFDTNAYSPNTQDVTTGTGSETANNTRTLNTVSAETGSRDTAESGKRDNEVLNTGTVTDDLTNNQNVSAEDQENIKESFERVEQGNIGVTMTQQMIKEQREIVQFNIYSYIICSFKNKFCIMKY